MLLLLLLLLTLVLLLLTLVLLLLLLPSFVTKVKDDSPAAGKIAPFARIFMIDAIDVAGGTKAAAMDAVLGVEEGEGPCLRRLAELPLMTLCWGAYGEGSAGVN